MIAALALAFTNAGYFHAVARVYPGAGLCGLRQLLTV